MTREFFEASRFWGISPPPPPHVGFVGHDYAPEYAGQWVTRHGLAKPVEHEPRGLYGHVVLAQHFAGADPALVAAHVDHDEQPDRNGHFGSMKYRAREYGELFAASGRSALPDPALAGGTRAGGPTLPVGGVEEVRLGVATVGTDDAVAPAQLLKQVVSVGLTFDPVANFREGQLHTAILWNLSGFVNSDLADGRSGIAAPVMALPEPQDLEKRCLPS